MKASKLLIIIVCSFLLTGCFDKVEKKPEIKVPQKEEEEIIEDPYVDDNQIKVGLYDENNHIYKRYNNYTTNMSPDVDLDYYQIVFSNEEEVSFTGNREDFIKSLWDQIETDFTLGITIEYDTLNEGHIKHVIYKPDNTLDYQPYIGVYLYDAISHKNDKWYSHITSEEFNENTYITSFKLTPGAKISEITSSIKLSVFTYDTEDDFDEEGNYRGNSIYTIEITKG